MEENVAWVLIRNSMPVYPFEKIIGMMRALQLLGETASQEEEKYEGMERDDCA